MSNKSRRVNGRSLQFRQSEKVRLRAELREAKWTAAALLHAMGGAAVIDPKEFERDEKKPELRRKIMPSGEVHLSLIRNV